MARQAALPATLAPRLINREAAAAYISVSASTFDKLVKSGRMPGPKRIDGRVAWDVRALDNAVDELPGEADDKTWDD